MIVNAKKFNEIVNERGVKLTYIARKAGLTNATITRVKQGLSVRPITICKIANVLNISASELVE